MAWVFSMWIETETKADREAVKEYFGGRIIATNNKKYTVCAYDSGVVTVDGISLSGITSQSDADEMTAIGFEFYELLKESPDFRYAITGVEVDGLVFLEELLEDPEFYLKFKGFVIQKELYERIAGKRKMKTFKKGYLWTPYEGETYT